MSNNNYHHRIHNPDKSGALYDSYHAGLEQGFGLKETLKHQGITSKPTTWGNRSGASWSDGTGDWHTNGVSAFKTSALRKQIRHITTSREDGVKDGEQVDSMVEDLIYKLFDDNINHLHAKGSSVEMQSQNDLAWDRCAIYFDGLDESEYAQGKEITRANFTLEDGGRVSVDAHTLFYLLNACEPVYVRHSGQRGDPIVFFNSWFPAMINESVINTAVAIQAPLLAEGTINEPKNLSILQRKGV